MYSTRTFRPFWSGKGTRASRATCGGAVFREHFCKILKVYPIKSGKPAAFFSYPFLSLRDTQNNATVMFCFFFFLNFASDFPVGLYASYFSTGSIPMFWADKLVLC